MKRISTVRQFVGELLKLDQDKAILIGDDDKYGRNDLTVGEIIRKRYEFDESNSEYYVIQSGVVTGNGCFKF